MALFSRTQPEDLRLRFFSAMRTVPADMAARLTQIDYDREMALVATGPAGSGEICGMVHLICDPDNEHGEFAALIRSDMKGRGIGFGLMTRLIDYARHRGVRRMVGHVLAENRRMLQLCAELGFTLRPLADEPGQIKATLNLRAP